MPASKAAPTALDAEKTVTLAQLQSTLQAWLRLLSPVVPPLRPIARGKAQPHPAAPRIQDDGIGLPDGLSARDIKADGASVTGAASLLADWYLAATAHAIAHLHFSRHRYSAAGVPPITQILLGILEDARVEHLAVCELPGLQRLWSPWHRQAISRIHPEDSSLDALLTRLTSALAGVAVENAHPWVRKGCTLFHAYLQQHASAPEPAALRKIASILGNDLGQMRRAVNPRSYRPMPLYRDDNHWLWYQPSAEPAQSQVAAPMPELPQEAADTVSDAPCVTHYPEWDGRIRRLRRNWCSIYTTEARAEASPLPHPTSHTANALALALRSVRLAHKSLSPDYRLHHEGDTLHLDAAVQASVLRRSGHATPAPVFLRKQPPHSHALLVLVDQSASTAAPASSVVGTSILDAYKQLAHTLLVAAQKVGWASAGYGFCSNGRHAVHLQAFKGFDAQYDVLAQQRLGGLSSHYSTRLGAVLRHAGKLLSQRPESYRILLVLGDADVHDIDMYLHDYLTHDARHALQALRQQGMHVACLCAADDTVDALNGLWGASHWQRVRGSAMLPNALHRVLGAG